MKRMKNLNAGWTFLLAMALISILFLGLPAQAQSDASPSNSDLPALNDEFHQKVSNASGELSHTFSLGSHWTGMFAPGTHLYSAYIADGLYPRTALNVARYSDSDIPEAGEKRYIFRIGGRLGLLRLFPGQRIDRGVQLNLNGAFLGMFDRENSLDNIGWDGLYGLDLSWQPASDFSFKFGLNHDSSHVGDEFAERTGMQRVDYTRQEYVLGASFSGLPYFRIYAETGYAFDLRNEELQDKWRVQGGLEFVNADCLWNGQMGCYAAIDLNAYEESDWDPDVTVQAGFTVPVHRINRTFRLGVEYRDGRSLIGEFSRYDETYWAWGIWIDL